MVALQVDVLIVVALKEELDALLELELGGQGRVGWRDERDQSGFPFHVRELPNDQGGWFLLAAAWAGQMGESMAATRATALLKELNPRCLAMCGICAGRREKVFLGDVIVADRVFNYDFGKYIAAAGHQDEGFYSDITTHNLHRPWMVDARYFAEEFQRVPQLQKLRPPSRASQRRWLLRALEAHERGEASSPVSLPDRLQRCPDWARCILALRDEGLLETIPGTLALSEKGRSVVREERLLYPDGEPRDPPFQVHVAPIATGKAVRQDPGLFKRLDASVRTVLGVEMEASAIGLVADLQGRRAIIVKAVSDYADHEKDDTFRDFACHAAAAFLMAFLRKHMAMDSRDGSYELPGLAGQVSPQRLAGRDLHGQNLSDLDLRRAELEEANLEGVTLAGLDLTEARLRRACLRRAVLSGATLRGADLREADLSGAQLLGADLRGAGLQGARLRAAKLSGARVDSLEGCDLFGAALPEVTAARPSLALAVPCLAVACSPTDVHLLASGHSDGTVRLWDAVTGRCVRVLHGHSEGVRSVAFSPDGTRLASASTDWTLSLWSVGEGRRLRVLEGHQGPVFSVAFSPDGQLLASGSDDRTLGLWSLEGARLRSVPGGTHFIRAVAFHPQDSALLASGSEGGAVTLWSVSQGRTLRVLQERGGHVRGVAFSPDGAHLAVGALDRTVSIWSVKQGQCLQILRGHKDPVLGVAFSPDGKTLASGSEDRTIMLWSVAGGPPLRTLKRHTDSVWGLAFSADGETLVSGSADRTLTAWSASQGQPLKIIGGPLASMSSVAFSPDGVLASASLPQTLALWDAAQGAPLRLFREAHEEVLGIAFSPTDRGLFATAGGAEGVQLHDTARNRRFSPLGSTAARALGVAFSPDGALLASAFEDGTVALTNSREGAQARVLQAHASYVFGVVFSPDGTLLATASADRTAALWRAQDGQRLQSLQGHSDQVRSVAFSPDGKLLATASADGTACLWSPATGALLATLLLLPGGWVAFRPDGGFKSNGELSGAFWHALGLCRFEPGELDSHLPRPLRLPDGVPVLQVRGAELSRGSGLALCPPPPGLLHRVLGPIQIQLGAQGQQQVDSKPVAQQQ